MPEHYALYFESGDDSNVARVVLGYTSLKIANDNMPFGAGFGMFASPISRQYKSHVYSDYGIDSVYGLDFERDGGMYMCDSFWPMLIGETGFLGTLLYIVILYVGFRPFIKRFLKNTRDIYAIFPTFLFIITSQSNKEGFYIFSFCFFTPVLSLSSTTAYVVPSSLNV